MTGSAGSSRVRPRRLVWPLLVAWHIWTSAVVDEAAIRFNLRLLATLTAVFSLPDLAQGFLTFSHSSGGARVYGAYVLALGLLEVAGALLLARHVSTGRRLIVAAAAGFYLEDALGLAGYERTLLAAGVFAVCAPAEAWVLWFLCHPDVRARPGVACCSDVD